MDSLTLYKIGIRILYYITFIKLLKSKCMIFLLFILMKIYITIIKMFYVITWFRDL